MLREGLLDGVRALVATRDGGAQRAPVAAAIEDGCTALGAQVATFTLAPSVQASDEEQLSEAVRAALEPLGGAELVVLDGAGLFEAAAGDAALLASMQGIWEVTRAVANEAMLAAAGGLVVLIAPAPGAGEHAEPARAGLENLARTLSIEWARFGARAVAVAPGEATRPAELAGLVAYLASPAGAYFSGCQLDLRGG